MADTAMVADGVCGCRAGVLALLARDPEVVDCK